VIAAACESFAEELVAYLDGEHTESERVRVESHLGTCLSCRREVERLRRLQALLGGLRPIEPSAEFEAQMWRRLDAMPARVSTRRRRVFVWGAPALAAAAAVALAWYGSLQRIGSDGTPRRADTVAQAPRPAASAGDTRVARGAVERHEHDDSGAVVASAPDQLDQYPPELVEHPELFLRYPVVRRLQKLEHFEEVQQHEDGHGGEPVGLVAPDPPQVG